MRAPRLPFLLLAGLLLVAPARAQNFLRVQSGVGQARFMFQDVEHYSDNSTFNIGIFKENFASEYHSSSLRYGVLYRHLQATSKDRTERGIETYRYDNLELQCAAGFDLKLFSDHPVFCLGADLGGHISIPLSMGGERTGPGTTSNNSVRQWDATYERPYVIIGLLGSLHATIRLPNEMQLKLSYTGVWPISPISKAGPEVNSGNPADAYKVIALSDRSFDVGIVFKTGDHHRGKKR